MKRHNGSGIILYFIMVFLIVIQAISQLLGLFFTTESTSSSSLIYVWLTLGNTITENWAAVSAFLIFLVLGNIMLVVLSEKRIDKADVIRLVVVLTANLALCLKVYSTESVSEKLSVLKEHIPTAIILISIALFALFVIVVVQKKRKADEEFERLFGAQQSQSGGNPAEGDVNGQRNSENTPEYDSELCFRMKHPFAYAVHSLAVGIAERSDEKRKNKLERQKEKQKTKLELLKLKNERKKRLENGTSDPDLTSEPNTKNGVVAMVLAVILLFAILICVFLYIIDGQRFFFIGEIGKAAKITIQFIIEKITGLGDASNGMTDLLIVCGVLFLLAVMFMVILMLCYAALNVFFYLVSHTGEDTKKINRTARAIKVFAFGTIDGILRPLLFLPDFLECAEDLLLDIDMDEEINEMFSTANPQSPPPSSSNTAPNNQQQNT